MNIRCPKCGAINKIPDHSKPNVALRCGKCHSTLLLEKQKTKSNHVWRRRWLEGDTKHVQFLRRHGIQLVLAVFGIVGTLLTVFATSRYGAGMSADAIAYVSCAKNLAAGVGYRCHYNGQDNVIYVLWPPLFPTLLAGLIKVGLEPLQGARLLNAFAFGLIIFTSGQLFRMFIKSNTLVILATLLILFSVPIFAYSTMALSEPLFALWGMLFAICLLKFLKERRLRFLLLTGLFAALSFLQRYMGVAFILTGGIVMLSPLLKSPLVQRLKYTALFGLVAVMPGAVWVARNLILTSTVTGERVLSKANMLEHGLYQNVQWAIRGVGVWFLPASSDIIQLVLGGFAVSIFLIAIIVSLRRRRKTGLDTKLTRAWPVGILLFIYILWLIASETLVPSEPIINSRFLLAMEPFAILLVFIGVENALRFLRERRPDEEFFQYVVLGLCALLVLISLSSVLYLAIDGHTNGDGWNSVVVWESQTMQWLKTNPLEGQVYSNAPDHIYFATGINAKFIASLNSLNSSSVTDTIVGNNKYLVLFEKITDESSYNFEELSSTLNLQEIAKFSDGAVYFFKD